MKQIILVFAAAFMNTFCFAQTDSTASDSAAKKSTLTLGAVYANNASYYGQKSEERTPYTAVAVTYKLKCGIYFSSLAYKLLNEPRSLISASSLGGGVTGKLGKRFSADLSYSHSFYAAYSPLLQAANPDNASLTASYEKRLKMSVTGDYAMGKTSDAFVTAAVSRTFNLFSITRKDIVILNPSIDAVAGTQHFYQTYLRQQKIRDSLFGTILNPITGGSPEQSPTETVSTTAFNLLTYNLKLPLTYNRAHYAIEANYQLSLLLPPARNGRQTMNSFFSCAFYYQF